MYCSLVYQLICLPLLWSQQSLNPCEGHPPSNCLTGHAASQHWLCLDSCLEAPNLPSLLGWSQTEVRWLWATCPYSPPQFVRARLGKGQRVSTFLWRHGRVQDYEWAKLEKSTWLYFESSFLIMKSVSQKRCACVERSCCYSVLSCESKLWPSQVNCIYIGKQHMFLIKSSVNDTEHCSPAGTPFLDFLSWIPMWTYNTYISQSESNLHSFTFPQYSY